MLVTRMQPRFASLHTCNPFEGLAGFRRMFDEPLANFLQEGMNTNANADGWKPMLDVMETKDGILLKVDLPGVKQEDINISIEDNMLTLKGERKNESEVSEEGFTRFERSHGAYQRSVALPPTVDTDQVKATYKNGVLEIRLPKKEEARPKAIKVEAA